jgi:tetratricopeptide (TPR) repeat protein
MANRGAGRAEVKCAACGHEVPYDAAFCGECGAPLAVGLACPACGRAHEPGQRFCNGCGARLVPGADPPAGVTTMTPGAVSFAQDRYRIERFLGEGAHKRVYLARDTTLERWIAFVQIKGDAATGDLAERIRREARTMASLPAHPNVVSVYDAGEVTGGPYIVEEYVDGGTVEDLLQQASGRPLAIDQALRIAAGACSALDHAHGHGIVHRDLKPANVWLTAAGTPKLGDFGLVAAMRESQSQTVAKLTGEGAMVGTLAYMAPEQALGKPLDPRSDLYSLGAMLYELVTGHRPFAGEDAVALISQHLRTPPVAPILHNPDVPGPLSELIVRLLAKDPRQRPDGAASVRAALNALATFERTGDVVRGHALEGLATGLYVGREQELDELCGAVDRAVAGSGEVVFITGDPGIGKTRLAEQVVAYAHMRDAEALWGRCYEGDGAPPYWPWVQIIRAYVLGHDPDAVAAVMGVGAADIAQMESEVRRRLPNVVEPPRLDAEEARFRLFDSVTRFLVAASREQPLVVVLDDLHCADRSSLLLLEFLARELSSAHLLVVGTYRGVELHGGHHLTHTLAELVRVRPPARIALGGLTRSQVGRYMQIAADVTPDESLVAAVFDKSEGNPFFVAEIVRLLGAGDRPAHADPGLAAHLSIPAEVREVIGQRLERLSDACRGALTVAAVMGRDFHLRPLQRVVGLSPDELLEALDEAVSAQVIVETVPYQYRFSHVLICDTLAEGVAAGSRIQLHSKIGAAIEEAFADRLDPWLSELAHHYLEAVPAGLLEKALQYATAAAEAASARLAHEEAARLYELALGALAVGAAQDERRCDLLLLLGDAHAGAGAIAQAREAFGLAAELARRLSSPERLVRAALGIGGPRASFGVVDEGLVELLEEALTVLGDRDATWRVRLLSRLAMELSFTRQQERRAALVEQAVAEARKLGDPLTLAYALNARHAELWGPANASERLALAGEVVELAERAGDRQLACEGRNHRVVALLETGDVAGAKAEIDAHARLAKELRQPFGLWQAAAWRCTMALLDGRFADGQALADEAFALGQRLRATDAEHCFAAQSLIAAMELGRLTELLDSLRELSERFPKTNWRAAAIPFILSEIGHREQAAESFEAAAADQGLTALPRDYQWLISVTALADACAFLGDARRAAELYGMLLPYAGQSVFMPEGWMCFGTVDRALGLLAATIGNWEDAEAHFEEALAIDTRMEARAWLARTKLGYAGMLLARAGPGDGDRARVLLEDAAEATRRLGMLGLASRVEEQLALVSRRRRSELTS